MTRLRNEELWIEIESLDAFTASELKSSVQENAWKWLEQLQSGNRLNSADLIVLRALLDSVFQLGASHERIRIDTDYPELGIIVKEKD